MYLLTAPETTVSRNFLRAIALSYNTRRNHSIKIRNIRSRARTYPCKVGIGHSLKNCLSRVPRKFAANSMHNVKKIYLLLL